MTVLTPLVLISKTLVLVFGLLIVRIAYRAYRRRGSRSLRSLTLAFGLITIGGVLGGSIDQVLQLGLQAGILANSLLTALGFAVLAYSLYASDDPA